MTPSRPVPPSFRSLVLVAVLALAPTASAFAAGELDCTFDGDGRKVQNLALSGSTEQANDLVVLADGSIVTITSDSDSTPSGNLFLARYLASGALDTTFGGGTGIVTVSIPGVAFGDFAFVSADVGIERDSVGRYVVVGSIVVAGGDREVFVGRLTSAGALDTTFGGGDGWMSFDWSAATDGSTAAFDAGSALALDASDRPIVGGTVDGNGPIFNPSNADFGIARLTTAGALDPTFGTGGITLVSSPGTTTDDSLNDLVLDPSGRVVAVGTFDPNLTVARDAMIVRLTAAGLPDASFDGDGVRILDLTQTGASDSTGDDVGQGVALTPDVPAKIMLAGFSPQTISIARLTDSGALDPSWGGDGIVSYDFEPGSQNVFEHLIVQPDGKTLMTGWIPFDFSVLRLETDGDLDPTWAGDGRQTVNIFNLDRAYASGLMADGRLVLAGGTGNDTDMALARFLGDTGSISGSSVTITSDLPDPSVVGQPFTVGISVTATTGVVAPTGTVTVGDGAQSATCALVPPGSGTTSTATCSLTLTTVGARTLTASYAGNGGSICGSVSAGVPHQVVPNSSTTTITSDLPDPSVVGQPVTVAFTVTAAFGTPTGNVTVSDGTLSCTAPVATGSCSLTFPSAGARTLTATFPGGGGIPGSTSPGVAHTVNSAATTTTITSDAPDPSVVGQSVVVQYTVAVAAPGSGTPAGAGTVTVTDGVTSCTGTVAAGQCALALATPGARTLTATYAGDADFAGSTSAGASHTVNAGATTVTIIGDTPDPSVLNAGVLVGWTVAPVPPAVGVPTGTVTITAAGGAETCSAPVAAGSCSLTLATVGARLLTATYGGDTAFLGATDTEAHDVVRAASTTTIDADTPDPSITGQPIQVSFTVASAATTPTGSVTVSDGVGGSCTGTLAAGTGSCTLSPASAGALTLTATYAGDTQVEGSQATTGHTVNPAATRLELLEVTPEPSAPGQPAVIAFALTVEAPGNGAPTGTVTITSDDLSCTADVSDGACAISFLQAGPYTLTASYAGDDDFQGSEAVAPLAHEVVGVVDIPTLDTLGLTLLALLLATLGLDQLRRRRGARG